ncbi:MAG: beta-glucoside-specific PTS transporter subunit IIABC [Propioniciclava sp.]
MASVDYAALAAKILTEVGGEENLSSYTHCATRLRLQLKDNAKADKAAVEKLPGVITVMEAGGQFQVVIGNNVPLLYAEMGKITSLNPDDAEEAPKGSLFNQFIAMISSIFAPMLWTMAGSGLLKAFLILFTTLGWMDGEATTYTILYAASDALLYFLPLVLAITAAKRFKAAQFTSMAIAGALVYPSIVALGAPDAGAVSFLGLPVVMMSYASSVIPIIVAVWVQGYLERFLNKVLPSTIRNFTTPLITLMVMVPLVLLAVGPLTTYAAVGISSGVNVIFTAVPWLGGAIMGGFWQVFVLFGLHWGFVPIIINELGTLGFSVLTGPLLPAVLAQAAATFAVMFRSRSAKRREVAGPAALSGFLAGITEPAIYGVNLPLKKPFYFGIVGGAIGGAISAAGGSAATAMVFPSVLAIPAFLEVGSFALQMIGTGVAVVVAFALTWVFGPREEADEVAPADEVVAEVTGGATGEIVHVPSPVAGDIITLDEVNDKVFASGAMGVGFGVRTTDGTVRAPVSGTVAVTMASKHAFGLKTDEGVEVLIHIGIDTVQLKGEHFTSLVEKGQRVEAGDVLATFDLEAVKAAGYDPTTIVVITNSAKLGDVKVSADAAQALIVTL